MAKNSSKGRSQRQLRVGEELRHALAGVLARGELRDPGVRGNSVTVTEVRVSPDLRNATAFIVPLGGGDATAVLAGLNRAAPYLRGRVARSVHLKFAPRFTFLADTSFDYSRKIGLLLRQPAVAADIDSGQGSDGEPQETRQ